MRIGVDLRVLSAEGSAARRRASFVRRQLLEVLRLGEAHEIVLFCRQDADLQPLLEIVGAPNVSLAWLPPRAGRSGRELNRPEDVLRATEDFERALDAQDLDVFHLTTPDLPDDLVPFVLDGPLVANPCDPQSVPAELRARVLRLVRRAEARVVVEDEESEDLGRQTLAAYEEAARARREQPRKAVRLALWTPVPPQESGISDYSVELLRELRRSAEIEIFVDDGLLPGPEVADLAPVRIFSSFARCARRRPFDAVLYQLGASYFHLYMDEALRQEGPPSIVTLHDLTWGALLYREATLWEGEEDLWRGLATSEGEGTAAEYEALAAGDPETLPVRTEDFLNRHLLLGGVIAASRAQIIHMPRAAADLAERYPGARVFDFPMGVEDPRRSASAEPDDNHVRRQLGIPEKAFLVGTFGVADPVKRLESAVRALARIAEERPEADPVLLVVGGFPDSSYRDLLESLAAELGLAGRVRLLGRAPQRDFDRALLACDVVVNLRYPFRHQMSATLMRALAAGKPVVITNVPSWDQFPASFCLRVEPDEREVETLAGHLIDLARDPARRREMGEAARRFWEERATPARMAEGYRRVLSEVLGREIQEIREIEEGEEIEDEKDSQDSQDDKGDKDDKDDKDVDESEAMERTGEIVEPDAVSETLPAEEQREPAPEARLPEEPLARVSEPLATAEALFQRWDALRARSAVQDASGGLGRKLGFFRRTAARIRDLGISWDLQRDLFRTLIDNQADLDRRLGAMESGGALVARLEAVEVTLTRFGRSLSETQGAVSAEVQELHAAQAELRGAVHEIRSLQTGFQAILEEMRAGGWDRNELANLRDRQESLRVRQTRLEGELADVRSVGRPPAVPLTPLDFAEILAAVEKDVPPDERAGSVEVSIQDLRAEDLLLAARRHFGGRLSASGYRGTDDLWLHVDFTADWNRPLLLENAVSRLTPGGRFLLVTAAAAAGDPPRQPGLALEEDRQLPLAGGGPVRWLGWRRGPERT